MDASRVVYQKRYEQDLEKYNDLIRKYNTDAGKLLDDNQVLQSSNFER